MRIEKSKEKAKILENIEKFLKSNNKKTMDKCYSAIRNGDNTRPFRGSIDELETKEFDSLFPIVSMVILTANKIECDSLNYIAYKKTNRKIKKRKDLLSIYGDNNLYSSEAYIFTTDSSCILHLKAYETGSNTPGGSADLVRYIANNKFIRPNCIISFGICYGRNPEQQQIGDVLIPKKLYPWSIAQKIVGNRLKIKHDKFNFDLEQEFSYSSFYSTLVNFYNSEDGAILKDTITFDKKSNIEFHIKNMMGNMSTGEAVVSSSIVKHMISVANGNEKEIGGEMEGYGVAKECIYYAKIPCIIIKSICDWGECKNIEKEFDKAKKSYPKNLKDKLQAYAAFCAGVSLFKLLEYGKTLFLSIRFLKWLDSPERGNDRCGINNYVDKTTILENIMNFYDLDDNSANVILSVLLSNKLLVQNGHRNYQFCT